MNVKIIDRTERPIQTIFKAYRTCYSALPPTEIEIPTVETSMGNYPNNGEMIKFIKDKIDLQHESPLEHVSFTFAIEGVSRALLAQITRHRTFKFSVQSQRYVNGDAFSFIMPHNVTYKDYDNKVSKILSDIWNLYDEMIAAGIEKEDARCILPNGTTTNLIVTADLRNFRHFLSERLCIHAQAEIRELADKMLEQVERIVPFVGYKARKCGVTCFQCKEK